MKKYVEVNLQHEALHHWPDADSLPEVSFLKHPHRHMFHIQLRVPVSNNDRQIEIILLKRQVEDYLHNEHARDFENLSCESIAEELMLVFEAESVRVLEDGENGAYVTK